jgi:hypothetical protein
MKRYQRTLIVFLAAAAFVICFATTASAGGKQSLVGTITDDYALETPEGEVLEIADTDMGNALLFHVGRKAEVVGVITEDTNGNLVLRVISYEIIE